METPRLLLVAMLLGCVHALEGCGSATAAEAPEPLQRESRHFLFESTSDKASEIEMEEGIALAEILFEKIAAFLGPDHTPGKTIRVVLEGDQATRGSYLDFDGIHLYRYAPEDGGYWAVFAHEMVHAFGSEWFIEHAAWNWPTYRFFDEGFAEYAAQEVYPEKEGFPFYGHPEDVISGHWLSVPELMIPFPMLRQKHAPLSDRCNLQAYTLRASWFRYLNETYGRNAVLQIVYPDSEPASEFVEGIVGVGLDAIDAGWAEWVRTRFAAHADTAAIVEAYTNRTPWYQVCVAGVDF